MNVFVMCVEALLVLNAMQIRMPSIVWLAGVFTHQTREVIKIASSLAVSIFLYLSTEAPMPGVLKVGFT